MLGIVNKLYNHAKPSAESSSKTSIYVRHCRALQEQNVRRSAYFDGALEGNSCSRLLRAVALDKIPFAKKALPFVEALKAFYHFQQKCLGNRRLPGWKESINEFGTAWDATGLAPTLKVHIVLHHVEQYLSYYESLPDAGLGISSEQSGEALHARLQRVWDLRFKVDPKNKIFPDRLMDCMVSYNWNLKWDEAERMGEVGDDDSQICSLESDSETDGVEKLVRVELRAHHH
ncbi:hypothetical protein Pmar_PMAR001561 [Perkinsus marinus ATCC 50983]|uniref:Uncharacterized protein n=1 Tax=Perkinsus marinus (strain ATCC 50983 / TXsc) TaxID=423536 RepID=C5K4L3_PERM5|nr:hypothetical protein Pmar_PMAR001561 [Perkinsus marinus ATCC 50983]EER20580.1 hypothetical protein Pmar_PMAR001561 [Perkinsus marinus ATCC 50983]|eukprot:XP_002788784.1 hypothetical protein Pmar_PMAR001561 [Perkinsus marinus ATCC 50983]